MTNIILACGMLINTLLFSFSETNLELKSELSKIEEQVNFKVFMPKDYYHWKMILKLLSSDQKNADSVLITFEDKKTEGKYIFDCIQTKSNDDHDINGSIVSLNGNEAIFTTWAASRNQPKPTGGILTWNQDGTNIEIKSSWLTKEEMIEIAKKMK